MRDRKALAQPLPGRPPRRAGWLMALVIVATPAHGEPPPGAERVELQLTDGLVVRGEVVVEAADGGVLVEHDDGRWQLVQPDDVARRSTAAARIAETPQQLGRRIVAELPPGFDLLVTKHYVICFDTSRDYAKWCAAVFERLYDAFGTYWERAGLDVPGPAGPLVVVIFADRHTYQAHSAATLGGASGQVAGYYDMLSNRVTTFDLTGSDALAAGRRPGDAGLAILSSPEAAGLVATLVHEATHQLAFNGGLHRRLAPVPLWVSEGIATYFETPDLRNERGWKAVGAVNPPRLERFLQAHRPGTLAELVRDDEPLRRPETAVDAYATAWAVTHHLLQTRKADFVGYLRVLATKQPLAEDSPRSRLEEFRAAFGEPDEVEARAFKAAARLAPRGR